MKPSLLAILLIVIIGAFSGCASNDPPLCGGSYKSDAEMRKALGSSVMRDSPSAVTRY